MAKSGRNPWFMWSLLGLLYLVGYILLVGEGYLTRMVESEQRYNAQFYSPALAKASTQRATRWFNAAFVDTGIMAHTFDPFIPTQDEITRSKGLEDFGQPLFHWFERRMRAWWTLLWAAFVRMSSVLLWTPFAPFLFVPWLVDGYTIREVRKHTFDYASPVAQSYAMRAIAIMPLLFVLLLLAPIPMHPLATPACFIMAGMLGQRAIGNYMKRI